LKLINPTFFARSVLVDNVNQEFDSLNSKLRRCDQGCVFGN